jgi:arsenate reductase-like glutaredoxin family protein
MQVDAFELILEKPEFTKTPVVSNGPESTVGYCPEVWEKWIKK